MGSTLEEQVAATVTQIRPGGRPFRMARLRYRTAAWR